MWSIVRRIVRIHINRIETDFVFLDVRIRERFPIVEVTTDLDPRLHPLLGSAIVAEVLLVLFERGWFDENAVVLKFLRPLVIKLNEQKDDAAQDSGEHVPPVGPVAAHFQRGPGENYRDRRQDQNRRVHRSDWNVEKTVRPFARLGIESQKNVGREKSSEEHYFGRKKQPDADLGIPQTGVRS